MTPLPPTQPGTNPGNPDPGPILLYTPNSVALGPATSGATMTKVITFSALYGPVTISSIVIAGTNWSLSGAGWVPQTLAPGFGTFPGTVETVTVSITSGANGVFPGTLTIVSSVGTFVINLTATYQAGLIFGIGPGDFPTGSPLPTGTIISLTESGSLVTAKLARPCLATPLPVSFFQVEGTGIVGYDGVWQIASLSSDFLTVTFNSTVTGLAPYIASATVPPALFIPLVNINLQIKNPNGAGSINVTAINLSDSNFMVQSVITYPIAIPFGTTQLVGLCYNRAELGQTKCTIDVANNGTVPDLIGVTNAFTTSLTSYSPMIGKSPTLCFGDSAPAFYTTDTIPSFPRADAVLIFNDPLWDNPGNEKMLQRLEVFYEDLGAPAVLNLLIMAWRPTLNNGAGGWDKEEATITIDSVTSTFNGFDFSEFFDLQISGEIIFAILTWPQFSDASGETPNNPVSITGFTPWFTDQKEKVEGQ